MNAFKIQLLLFFLVHAIIPENFSDSIAETSPASNQLVTWFQNRSYHEGGIATSSNGIKVPSLTASQAIGTRGHVLLQDFNLIQKLSTFNRERIPERVVHAKGAGAHGYFVVTHDISEYTKAKFLNGVGKKTKIFVRFSTTAGELGSPDMIISNRGFAVKFYTEDGNHDLVGNVIPVFNTRDPALFPDQTRVARRNPQTNLNDQNAFWDFANQRPESTLTVLHIFSDRGRPDGFRRVDGFGIHAFKLVNDKGKVVFAKFSWLTNQPARALTLEEVAELTGSNPDYHTQDLYDAIARGDFPSWTLYIQVMTIEQAKNYRMNPFDVTKTWRREEFPLIPVGKLVLDRNPENFFVEVEQAGFTPGNMVPGIEASPDRMLAGRIFAYLDALNYRLGVNWQQLQINRPITQVNTYSRDGKACYDNPGGHPNYFPNSFGGHVPDTEGAAQVSFRIEGIVDRYDIQEDDDFDEPRLLLKTDIGSEERQRMVSGIVSRLINARKEIRERVLRNMFYKISKSFGDEVRLALEEALEQQRK